MIGFIVSIVAFLASFLFTGPTIALARRLKLVTDDTKRFHPAHTHKGIVPRAGGVPIFLAILLTVILFLPVNKIVFGILLASSLLVLIGTIDDYSDVSPYLRFGANLLIAAIVIQHGLGIHYLSNPYGEVIRLDRFQIPIDFLGQHTIWFWADILSVV